MLDDERVSSLEGLFRDVIIRTGIRGVVARGVPARPAREVRSLARKHYGLRLRRSFDRRAIDEFVSEGRRLVWPHLNAHPLRLGSPKEFRKAWSPLGIELRTANLSSPSGLALMGFYIEKNPASKRPLICVNTAHHQAAISAAFAHEMGHHLTAKMFALKSDVPRPMGYTGYAEHLDQPSELAADILVSLGIFPRNIARQWFDESHNRPAGDRGETASIADAVAYIANRYGFNRDHRLSAASRLQYLAGVLHYAKLRKALFQEFGV